MPATLLLVLMLATPLPEEGRVPLHAPPRPPFARLEQSLRPEGPPTDGARPAGSPGTHLQRSPHAEGFRPPQLFALEPPPAFSGGVLLEVQGAGPQALPPFPGATPTGGLSLERVMRLYRSSGPRRGLQLTVVPGPPCWP